MTMSRAFVVCCAVALFFVSSSAGKFCYPDSLTPVSDAMPCRPPKQSELALLADFPNGPRPKPKREENEPPVVQHTHDARSLMTLSSVVLGPSDNTNSPGGGITFQIYNGGLFPVAVSTITSRLQEVGAVTTVNCYYRPGAITSNPFPLIGNGWTLAKSQSGVVAQGRRVEVTVCSGLFVVIQAGQTVAFGVSSLNNTGLSYQDGLGVARQYTQDGVTLMVEGASGWVVNDITLSDPVFHPRSFLGSVTIDEVAVLGVE